MKKLVIGIIFTVAAAATLPCAAAGAAFTYQGVIKEVDGATPSVKNRTIEFRIYDGPGTSAQVLGGRAYNVLLDANGLFNTSLTDAAGSEIDGVPSTGLADVLARNSGTTLYIGLTVDNSSGEISPRQALLAVPYAIHASDAAAASGDFTVEGKTTLKGNLEVTGGTVSAQSLEATSLVVNGNITASTSGSLSGYGVTPVGGIIMWSGSPADIPDGWALCDGRTSNGRTTPNLSGKFIVGYSSSDSDYNPVGKTGGEKKHTLTVAEMPSHTHNMKFKSYDLAASWKDQRSFYSVNKGDESQNDPKTTQSTGGGQSHENRPPYYALCFIMRVK